MLFVIFYFSTFFTVLAIRQTLQKKYVKFPRLKFKKFGFVFTSNSIHKLKVHNYKVNILKNNIYLSLNKNVAILKNVRIINVKKDDLYFQALGEVKIIFDCESVYRYYNLIFISKEFNLNILKHNAKLEILNNLLSYEKCELHKKLIFFIKNILKININAEKIEIKRNKLKIFYNLVYKLNGNIKKINISETL